MLHVRVVSPPGATGDLIERLSAAIRASATSSCCRAPRGTPTATRSNSTCSTQFANPVLQELRAQRGNVSSIVIENVDVSIIATGDPGDSGVHPHASGRPRFGELPPVWELVEAKIRAGGQYPPSFFALLIIAGLIGAVGILTNSQILIVAAMVVGPEYSAIMATALGINKRDRGAVTRGLTALVVGFALAVLVTLVFGLLIRWSGETPRLYDDGVRPVSDLINSPNVFSVIVAVLAGIVGVVSLTESRANALIGVFISVTTIPAASDMGLSAAYGSWPEARGSTFQLLLNVAVLIAVGAAGLRLQRAVWRNRTERAAAHPRRPAPPPPA